MINCFLPKIQNKVKTSPQVLCNFITNDVVMKIPSQTKLCLATLSALDYEYIVKIIANIVCLAMLVIQLNRLNYVFLQA